MGTWSRQKVVMAGGGMWCPPELLRSFRVLMQSMLGTNTTNVRKVFIFLLRNSQFLESLKKNRLNNCVIKIIMPYYRPTN